jgi:MoaA/NifB/PqqE/SkfB family radical SAM enzyme
MSFITTYNLTSIMAEMSDYCNAACPMCNRYDWDLNLVKGVTNQNHTTLEFVKEKIGNEIISRLKSWVCQGTYGDASMNPEAIEIFSYLKEINPIIKIVMHTNGGARNIDFWKKLADLKVSITFAIDGLEDTNHLYRRNVKWPKLMENVKSFIDAGGKAEWSFLIFKHNEHQIEEAKKLSKELGFVYFNCSFSERWQDFNSAGEYRDIQSLKVDDYIIEKPTSQKNDFVKIENFTKSKNVFQIEEKNDFYTRNISCHACKPSAWQPNKREIYLRANGYVSPCCILGDVERDEPKQIIKNYNKINLHYTDLKDILEGDFFKDLYNGINGGEKRLQGCFHACGVK